MLLEGGAQGVPCVMPIEIDNFFGVVSYMTALDATVANDEQRQQRPSELMRPVAPLLWLWLLFGLTCLAIWLRWGRGGWPVGSFWWDELALAGAAHAIGTGLVPAVDFWAPFLLPLYVKHIAQSLAGMGGGGVLECLFQGGMSLLLLTGLLGRRRHEAGVYVLGAATVLMAVLPFNIGGVVSAKLGTVVFAGVYNRFGGALIMLGLMAPVVRDGNANDGALSIWMAILLVGSFLVKVTVLQIVLVLWLAYAVVCRDGRWLRLTLISAALAGVALVAVLGGLGVWDGYLEALREVSVVRMSLMSERLDFARDALVNHKLELQILLICGLLAAWRGQVLRIRWVGLLSWYLMACMAITLYMLTNFGDNGLFPSAAALFALSRLQSRAPDATNLVLPASAFGLARLLERSMHVIFWIFLATHVGLNIFWMGGAVLAQNNQNLIHFPVSSQYFHENYLIDAKAWENRVPLSIPGVAKNMQSSATFAGYVDGLDEAVRFLSNFQKDHTKSVYALDYPAYVFALAGGYRVPRGTYPWLLFGHELSIDSHPPARTLFADVDVLLIPKCSLSSGNQRYLSRLYRLEIEQRWGRIGALRCWDVYQKH